MGTATGRETDLPHLPPPLGLVERQLEAACGLAFSSGVEESLAEALRRAARALGLARETCLDRLRGGDRVAVEALVEQALVRETYFYRHPEQLAAVGRWLAEAPRERPLALWSAGCASGEEAWTLAMLLRDAGRTGLPDTVLGTDVSGRALEAAAVARYGEWSLRELPVALRARHFVAEDGALVPVAGLRGRVRFLRQNLVRDPPPGRDFDLVVCRNVLLYFRPATAERVVRTVAEAVRPGGLLLLGPIEEPLGATLAFERIDAAGAVLWRRPRHGGGEAR